MFCGHHLGSLDQESSANELLLPGTAPGQRNQIKFQYHRHVRLAKPHGSLDWHSLGGRLVRCELPLDSNSQRLIVVPGDGKYRAGYNSPFDEHRARANHAIEHASGFLILGFGFNDDHLQTRLRKQLQSGVPAIVASRTLTDSARAYLAESPSMLGLERMRPDGSGTRAISDEEEVVLEHSQIWNVNDLAREVLGL
jgi:hypothetical protein